MENQVYGRPNTDQPDFKSALMPGGEGLIAAYLCLKTMPWSRIQSVGVLTYQMDRTVEMNEAQGLTWEIPLQTIFSPFPEQV